MAAGGGGALPPIFPSTVGNRQGPASRPFSLTRAPLSHSPTPQEIIADPPARRRGLGGALARASPSKRPPPPRAPPADAGASPPKKPSPAKKVGDKTGDAKAAATPRDKGAARSLGSALADAPAPRRAPRAPKPKPKPAQPKPKPAKAAPATEVKAPRRQTRTSLPSFMDALGATHRRGGFVYCALDDAIAASLVDSDDAGAVCAGCGEGHKPVAGCGGKRRGKAAADDDDDGVPIVECAACLDGWHLDCVDPPLARVPEAEWLCPPCEAGRKAAVGGGDDVAGSTRRPPRTRAEAFLAGRVGIVRVESIWQEVVAADEEKKASPAKGKKKAAPSTTPVVRFSGYWAIRPEETHTGRARGHAAREVFLTPVADANDAACVLGAASVVSEAAFATTPGDDVWVCRYEYSGVARAFRPLGGRRRAAAALAAAVGDEAATADAAVAAAAADPATAPLGAAADASDDDEVDDDSDSDGGRRRRRRGKAAAPGDGEWRPAQGDLFDAWARGGARVARPPTHGRKQPSRAKKQGGGKLVEVVAAAEGGGDGGADAAAAPATTTTAPRSRSTTPGGAASAADATSLPLSRARAALAASADPCGLPGRDSEIDRLTAFISGAAADGAATSGRCLYVYGVPGTGKTAAVRAAAERAAAEAAAMRGRAFNFVELNALRLPSPRHVYARLLDALYGERASPAVAHDALNARVGAGKPDPNGCATILLVDEMDLLVTRNQAVLYNLFEWPARPASGLAVIGVANTMDLPDRLLPRIASRFGGARLPFAPYTPTALAAIVTARLEAAGAGGSFEARAVQYAARRVGAAAGDVRRALEVCRAAVDAAVDDDTSTVTMAHVDAALHALGAAPATRALAAAPAVDVLLLAALAIDLRACGRSASTLACIAPRLADLAAAAGLPTPSLGDAAAAAARLGAQRVLVSDGADRRAAARLQFDVPLEDVVTALKARGGRLAFLRGLTFASV